MTTKPIHDYLLTPKEIRMARYAQIVACMNAEEIAADWCRRQAKKIVEILAPYVHVVVEDERMGFQDGNALVDPLVLAVLGHHWMELENAAGIFRSPSEARPAHAAEPDRPSPGPDVFIEKGFPRPTELHGTVEELAERALALDAETHTCYYCNHEGPDVNRVAELADAVNRRGTHYCCEDGDACDARIKEAA